MAEAQCNLGHLYKNGMGVPQDYEKAKNYYELAAAQGFVPAKSNIQNMSQETCIISWRIDWSLLALKGALNGNADAWDVYWKSRDLVAWGMGRLISIVLLVDSQLMSVDGNTHCCKALCSAMPLLSYCSIQLVCLCVLHYIIATCLKLSLLHNDELLDDKELSCSLALVNWVLDSAIGSLCDYGTYQLATPIPNFLW